MPAAEFRFTDRQRAALTAIVDTFAPGADGLPAASEHGVVEAIEQGVASNPRKAERRQVGQLLGLWDTSLLTALGGGGRSRFSALSRDRREDVLRSWRDSRVPQRRGAYQALRKAALLTYYMKPGPDGRTSPMWERAGFPGPPGPAQGAAPPRADPDRRGPRHAARLRRRRRRLRRGRRPRGGRAERRRARCRGGRGG